MFHGPAQEALGYFSLAGMVDFHVVGPSFTDSWSRTEGSAVVMQYLCTGVCVGFHH
jgi:hypothetical protein